MKTNKQNRKSGFTLIEVLLTALILAFLVIGGSATLHYTGSNIVAQGNKRIALEIANQRMELAKANSYLHIAPDDYDVDDTYFLNPNNTDPKILDVTTSNTREDVTVGDLTYKMLTKVLRHSKNGGTVGFEPEALQVTVAVEYRSATGESVELTTILLPPQVAQ